MVKDISVKINFDSNGKAVMGNEQALLSEADKMLEKTLMQAVNRAVKKCNGQ